MLVTFRAAWLICMRFGKEGDSIGPPFVVEAPATHPAIEVPSSPVTVNDAGLFLYRAPYGKALDLIRSAGGLLPMDFPSQKNKYGIISKN